VRGRRGARDGEGGRCSGEVQGAERGGPVGWSGGRGGGEGLGERDRLDWRGGLGFDRAHRISGRVRVRLARVCLLLRRDRVRVGPRAAWVCSMAHRDCLYFDVQLGGMDHRMVVKKAQK
jgi:hypothetical protein